MALMKMTLLSFKSFDKPADLLKPRLFLAMFNPASYKVEYSFVRDSKEATGSNNQTSPVTAVSLKKMTFDFLIDGTGANGDNRVVLIEAKKFEKMVLPEKKEAIAITDEKGAHLTLPKLLLVWGTFFFHCEIDSYSVNYTLFNQFGIPLRATISATFQEIIPASDDLLTTLSESETLDTITNVASFLSTAFTVTNNVGQAIGMAREENLNSLRQRVIIK